MKTNQIMTRNLGGFEIQQRTQDGYFDLNALLMKWNDTHPNSRRRKAEDYLGNKKTKEFIEALAIDEMKRAELAISQEQKNAQAEFSQGRKNAQAKKPLVIKASGRYHQGGRTPDRIWVHPLIFIDFAMWINPTFKVQALRFVADKMLEFRNEAGEAYKRLSRAVAKLVEKKKMRESMQKVGEALNWIVFGNHEKMLRNKQGEELKMCELFELERKITELVEENFISDYDTLMEYLRNQWKRKYVPTKQIA